MPELALADITLNYQEFGDTESPAVLLLHGFTSDNRMWRPHFEPLSEDYRVIVPDMRGHGRSTAPEDLETYTMEAYAADIAGLLDGLEIDICAVIGCGFGGMVALQFATTWPERVAGLVLSDTSAAYDHPDYDEKYREREARIAAEEGATRTYGRRELGRRAAKDVADEFLAAGVRKSYERISDHGFLGAAQVRRSRPNLLPVLKERLTMPVLICIGEDDPVNSACAVMGRELPEARYIEFKGQGHGLPARTPEKFGREVLAFFNDIEEGRPVAGRRTVG
jgi:pimeloyl-ACP methyl ester carboxylesterase